jgi:hypothetical protein
VHTWEVSSGRGMPWIFKVETHWHSWRLCSNRLGMHGADNSKGMPAAAGSCHCHAVTVHVAVSAGSIGGVAVDAHCSSCGLLVSLQID